MIEKDRYVKHIRDTSLKQVLTRVLDQAEIVLKKHIIRITDFLNPYELGIAEASLKTLDGISWFAIGGYENAERKVLLIFQDYLSNESIPNPLVALNISRKDNSDNLNHRDYLGSLLSLGIRREKVGDIIINKDNTYIILKEELRDYVMFHYNKIKHTPIRVDEIGLNEIVSSPHNYKEIRGTIASLRLDSVVSLGFRLSRTEAQSLIIKEKVFLNWQAINKNFCNIQAKDVISVRGMGRVIVDDIEGRTKAGRIHIVLKKLI